MYKFLIIILLQGILMGAVLKELNYKDKNISVIFEQNNHLPIFNLQLIFKNSGYINDKDKAGITRLTAKLLNEGTKKDGAIKFARKLENKAISIEMHTGFETFVIEISCLKEQYKDALSYLVEILKDPNFQNEPFQKQQYLTISKIKQKEDNFDWVASTNLKNILYANTPLAHSSLGDEKSIENLTLDDIKKRSKEILNINNLIIATGGDINYQELVADLQPVLKQLTNNKTASLSYIKTSDITKEDIIYKETQQSYIYFGSPFYLDSNSKDNYKAKVASFILGGSGFGSRLMEEIRVKNGLAYSAYGYITNKKSSCSFQGYLQTKLDNTNKAKQMIKDIIKTFVKNGVTKKELEAAKKFLSGSEPLRTETFSQRLNRAFSLYYKGLKFDYPKKELEMIENLTLQDLNKFIKKHSEITKLSFSIVTQKD